MHLLVEGATICEHDRIGQAHQLQPNSDTVEMFAKTISPGAPAPN